MGDTHRENAILLAIDIIADKKISQASFDKTIKAVIKEVTDLTTGKYLVRYQDSEFTAYTTSTEVHYQTGEEVYILIPGNDFMGVKRIIGSSNNKAIEYKELTPNRDLYNKIGTNVVTFTNKILLSSYRDYIAKPLVYPNVPINSKAIDNYIQHSDSLAIGMTVQTKLASSQTGGWYGLIFNLLFKDLNSEDENAVTVKPYVVSSKDIIGNPYAVTKETVVEILINTDDIDVTKFKGIQSIEVLCDGFPLDESKENIKDIFLSNIYISGAEVLTEENKNGYLLNIDYSETGNIIEKKSNNTPNPITDVILKAQLKIKGKITTEDIDYYWFRLDGSVFRGNSKYSSYAGDGWECLNQFLSANKPIPFKDGKFVFYGDSGSSYKENLAAAASLQKVTKVKCVAIYDNNKFEGECQVINENISEITIESSDQIEGKNKTIYYLDNGSPTLTCKVYHINEQEQREELQGNFIYKWSRISLRGKGVLVLSQLAIDTKEAEKILHNAEIMSTISKEAYIQTSDYQKAKAFYLEALLNPRVVGNKYYNFPIHEINQSERVCCAVWKKEKGELIYKGTTSITLENRSTLLGFYTLSLEYGTQVFQYDNKGNSPTGNHLEKPLDLHPLTFTLLDNQGKEITHTQIRNNGLIRWIYPDYLTGKTLIINKNKDVQEISGDLDFTVRGSLNLPLEWQEYKVIKDLDLFVYDVSESYDAKKRINYIWLNIKYKDMIFNAYTDFTFPKDGDPGTNGTDFIAKLSVPGSDRLYVSNLLEWPFGDTGLSYSRNNPPFVFELYNNSKKVEGLINPTYECPIKEKEVKQKKCYINSNLEGAIQKSPETFDENNQPVDIIRAKYKLNDIQYYAEYPICYNKINDIRDEKGKQIYYRIRIVPRTGFKYVVYSSDGTSPNYDNTLPFLAILEERMFFSSMAQPVWIKVLGNVTFNWEIVGNPEENYLLIIKIDNQQRCFVKPKDTFDGADLSSAIICRVKLDGENIGFIHIPIYMILNRYGHQALNDWDGNSILLNGAGNTILAPQIGAGVKHLLDNTFTGVFMGTIDGMEDDPKDPNNPNNLSNKDRDRGVPSDNYKIGFAGYNHGARTIFLDSKTGKALFGKQNAGRIILDPSQQVNGEDAALIYSGNYPIKDFLTPLEENIKAKYNVFEVGLLQKNRNKDNKGMIIDLSTPQIGFGSGNFTVNNKGHIVAKGGGLIAGWSITDDKLHKNNKVGMASQNEAIPSSIGLKNKDYNDDTVAFWAGGSLNNDNSLNSANFYATHGGYIFGKLGQIAGWDFNSQRFAKDNVGMNSDPTNSNYILKAADNSSGWPDKKEHKAKAFFANGDNFYVTHDGYLRSISGKIATWNITDKALYNEKTGLGEKQYNESNPFKVGINARLWSEGDTGLNFAVSNTGNLYSRAGKIGGWTIGDTSLKASGITISSNGSITSSKWGVFNDDKGSRLEVDQGRLGTVKIDNTGISGTNWYIREGSAKIPGLQVDSNGNIYYTINGSSSDKGTGISGSGGNQSGLGYDNSGKSYCAPGSTYTSAGGSQTLEKFVRTLVALAIYSGSFVLYDSLKINKDGTDYTRGQLQVSMQNGQILFVPPITFCDTLDILGSINVLQKAGSKKGTLSGDLKFSNNAHLYFAKGLLYDIKIPAGEEMTWGA